MSLLRNAEHTFVKKVVNIRVLLLTFYLQPRQQVASKPVTAVGSMGKGDCQRMERSLHTESDQLYSAICMFPLPTSRHDVLTHQNIPFYAIVQSVPVA